MASRPLIKESLFLLNICGINPLKQHRFDNILRIISVVMTTTLIFELSLECAFNWNRVDSMETFSMLIAAFQMQIKLYASMKTRKKMASVIDRMNNFSSINSCDDSLKNEIHGIYENSKRSMRLMMGFGLVLAAIYIFQALLSKPRKLIYNGYHPTDKSKSPQYEFAFLFQFCFAINTYVFLFGYDGLLVGLILNISCEFKIIKKRFASIPIASEEDEECESEAASLSLLFETINHHALILQCVKDVRNIYSMMLLSVFCINMASICAGLLAIVATGFPPGMENLIRYTPLATFFLMQLFSYCVTGYYVTSESEDISLSVYSTDWWIKNQPELRRAYIMIIRRAHKLEEFTVGGVFPLNLDSFKLVMKALLLFSTMVIALCNRRN